MDIPVCVIFIIEMNFHSLKETGRCRGGEQVMMILNNYFVYQFMFMKNEVIGTMFYLAVHSTEAL